MPEPICQPIPFRRRKDVRTPRHESVIRPSVTWTRRPARAATAGSCVMSTTVRPCALSAHNRSITSRLARESRLPVGSSASSTGGSAASARDGHALLLPAGELAGPMAHARVQSYARERRSCALPAFASAYACDAQRQLDVFQRRQPRQQVKPLKDEPDLAPAHLCELILPQRLHAAPVQAIRPRAGPVQAAHDVHQRRLARSGRPDDRHEFAPPHIEVHVRQRCDLRVAHPVDLAHVYK